MTLVLVTLGMAAGSAYVLSRWFRELLSPVSGLLRALRPLLIPVLVLLAASTVNQSPIVQGLAALALLPLVYGLVVGPELAETGGELGKWWHAIENGAANAVKRLGVATFVAVLVAWFLLGVVFGDDGPLKGLGGLSGAFLIVALVALGLALLARLVAFASSVPRGAVSVLFGFTCAAGLMFAGVLPFHQAGGWAIPYLTKATGAAMVVAILVEAREQTATGPRKRSEGAGLGLAMVAGAAFVGATASSLWALNKPDHTPLGADKGAHATLYTDEDSSLQYRYAPVLAFTADQHWTPVKVDDYLADADVVRPDGKTVPYGDNTCPSIGPRSCLRITIGCARVADGCARTTSHNAGDHISDGAVYVRTVRRPARGDASDEAVARRALFRPVTPTARQMESFVQYWFFYPYDEWTTKVLGGRLTQRHEGDWEAVTVGFGAEEKPLFVAYSAHCGGRWTRWNRTKRFQTHPLVAVANGSQANYSDTSGHRPPDWTSCTRLPRGIGALLSYAANVRDRTSDDWQWGAAELINVTEKDPPINFPGSWGDHDVTEFENLHRFSTKSGGGPKSPPLQSLWQTPISTIFCDRYWDGPESCKT
jgi:hypothetical protein